MKALLIRLWKALWQECDTCLGLEYVRIGVSGYKIPCPDCTRWR